MSTTSTVSRRDLLRGLLAAGGVVLAAPLAGGAVTRLLDPGQAAAFEPNLWIALAPDGALSIVTHRSEMGTGIRTTLPMVLADEMGADWERVELVQALGDPRYGDQNTDGSRSIRQFFEPMRQAGASARLMLERAAAARWGVDPGACVAQRHTVVHEKSGRWIPFGELAAEAAAQPVPDESDLRYRATDELRYVGKGVDAADNAAIVTGQAEFGIDVARQGGLVAVIARPPVLGAPIVSVDEDASRDVEGVVEIVRLDVPQGPPAFFPAGGVAVVAADTWSAIQGRNALEIEWGPSPHDGFSGDGYATELRESVAEAGTVMRDKGDAEAALRGAVSTYAALYETPHLAHASMEPPCATAIVRGGRCEAWAPTQNPQAARDTLAGVLRMSPEDVDVHVTLLGGGFGRKSKPDFVAEAALISREMGGRPIRVQWTREDDIRHDYYHAAAAVALEAGFDEQGEVVGVRARSAHPSIGSTFMPGVDRGQSWEIGQGLSDMPYDFPALRVESCRAEPHLRIGWLRSVCNIFHGFAVSSFVDELAVRAGRDPLEHLLARLGPDRVIDFAAEGVEYGNYGSPTSTHPYDVGRMKRLVELVGARSGWGGALPRGEGRGVAVHRSFVSDVAVVVHAKVTEDGKLSVPRVDIAMDCGRAIHPERVRAQCEGSVIFGLSLAMHGEIGAEGGAVTQSNVHDYKLLRMSEAPGEIHVHLVESDAPPGGVGEPGVPPVAPALANAVAAATGRRVRSLPLSRHDLSWS